MFKKIVRLLKAVKKNKFIFSLPKKGKVFVFDWHSKNYTDKLFNKEDLVYFATRNEEFNIIIYLKCILKGKFSRIFYIVEYIKFVKPKIVITFIDNNMMFYKLRNFLNIPTAFFQVGHRTYHDIFGVAKDLKLDLNSNLKVDYMFVYNNIVGKKYKSFINGEYFPIGSALSNSVPINSKKKNRDLIYISNFRLLQLKKSEFVCKGLTWREWAQSEIVLINTLKVFCLANNLQFTILGKYKSNKSKYEYDYFSSLINSDKWKYIENSNERKNYNILDESQLVTGTVSTLLHESIGRKNKTVFFGIRPDVYPINTKSFGYFLKRPKVGPFWVNKVDEYAFQIVLNNIYKLKEGEWKKLLEGYDQDVTKYDNNNVIFKEKFNNLNIDFPVL